MSYVAQAPVVPTQAYAAPALPVFTPALAKASPTPVPIVTPPAALVPTPNAVVTATPAAAVPLPTPVINTPYIPPAAAIPALSTPKVTPAAVVTPLYTPTPTIATPVVPPAAVNPTAPTLGKLGSSSAMSRAVCMGVVAFVAATDTTAAAYNDQQRACPGLSLSVPASAVERDSVPINAVEETVNPSSVVGARGESASATSVSLE
ncbi:hypothetical protein HDU77_009898 [Chytriomyces hyalinus]|nr:hypothetical protein HDU77_009898 [Chytriomyces hyalinus]